MTIPAPYGTPDVWKSLIFRRQGFYHGIEQNTLPCSQRCGQIKTHIKTPER